VHERSRGSDGSWQPLRAAGAGKESNHRFGQTDLVVAILGDAKVAGSANSKAPARHVPEMAAMTGFGMLSLNAIALSKNPPL
jgi:hypothetical protein